MAVYLTYLNLAVSAVLAIVCWWLYYDGRGRRTTAKAAKLPPGVPWEADMLARVVGHDLRIAVLERALPVSAELQGRLSTPPPRRSPKAVEAMVAETQGKTKGAPVEMTGDRAGLNPGDDIADRAPETPPVTKEGDDGRRTSSAPPPPVVVLDDTETETPEQIRARLEATEDAREAARAKGETGQLPKLAPNDDDEATQVRDAGDVRDAIRQSTGAPSTRRPTLLGGLRGGAPPPSVYPTLVSPRALDTQAPPLTPHPPILPPPNPETNDGEVSETERAYEVLRAKVRNMGLKVDHCHTEADGCSKGDDARPTPPGLPSAHWRRMSAPDVCRCNCEGCRRAFACFLQAQRAVRRARRDRGE